MAKTRPQTIYRIVRVPLEHREQAHAEVMAVLAKHGVVDLYTGLTNSLPARLREHATTPKKWLWWRDIDLIIPEHLRGGIPRQAAENIETQRIKKRRPKFNTKDNEPFYDHAEYRAAEARYYDAMGIKRSWRSRLADPFVKVASAINGLARKIVPPVGWAAAGATALWGSQHRESLTELIGALPQ